MADGSQISTSVTIISSLLGWQAISLSEMSTSAATVIKAGSKCEVASAFFTFASDCTPNATTWTAITTSMTAYLSLVPSGTAGSQVVSAEWIASVPVWSDSKQGWYASAASSSRIVASVLKKGATSYWHKFILPVRQDEPFRRTVEIGSWDMDATSSVSVLHYVGTTATIIGTPRVFVRGDTDTGDRYPLDGVQVGAAAPEGGVRYWNASLVYLTRRGGGQFDVTAFDDTSVNRGWIELEYTI